MEVTFLRMSLMQQQMHMMFQGAMCPTLMSWKMWIQQKKKPSKYHGSKKIENNKECVVTSHIFNIKILTNEKGKIVGLKSIWWGIVK